MLKKCFTLFHGKAIEKAVQVASNFFWFLSYEFPNIVVLVTEQSNLVVQYEWGGLYIVPSFICRLSLITNKKDSI